jgi:hypothetical protein
MQLDFAFLCDAASDAAGKIYALGIGIDRLQVQRLPARHGRLAFVSRVSFDVADAGDRSFSVRLIDADGRDVIPPVQGEMHIAISGPGPAKANLIIDLVNPEFQSHGPHEVTLALDGTALATLPLEVVPG